MFGASGGSCRAIAFSRSLISACIAAISLSMLREMAHPCWFGFSLARWFACQKRANARRVPSTFPIDATCPRNCRHGNSLACGVKARFCARRAWLGNQSSSSTLSILVSDEEVAARISNRVSVVFFRFGGSHPRPPLCRQLFRRKPPCWATLPVSCMSSDFRAASKMREQLGSNLPVTRALVAWAEAAEEFIT